jgi:hypothetical protein
MHYRFRSSPRNGNIKELHLTSAFSPPRQRLPSLLRPIKGVGSITIYYCIYSLSSFKFLLHNNSFSQELNSSPPPLLSSHSHPPHQATTSEVHRETLLFPSLHGELPYTTTTQTPISSYYRKSTVNWTLVTITVPASDPRYFSCKNKFKIQKKIIEFYINIPTFFNNSILILHPYFKISQHHSYQLVQY